MPDPLPASPPSTGLVKVKKWNRKPEAKSVYVGSKRIVAYRFDGSVLGDWVLPGDLHSLIAGLTLAFGHSPVAAVNGVVGWKYTWPGFIIYDNTPEVVGPTDPPYEWNVTVSHVDGVLVHTVDDIHVGTSGTVARAIADVDSNVGFYVAELLPYHLSVPTTGSPVLWAEVVGGPVMADPITEMSGPVASWLS
jgi:hypothetical protein